MEESIVSTIKENCRRCYACVRECPVKAIRITGGMAKVEPTLCLSCGRCVKACSREAKKIEDGIQPAMKLLAEECVAAMVAPSFVAEFADFRWGQLVAALKKAGFRFVVEVAAGAELVAEAYRQLLNETKDNHFWISTACPVVVSYIQMYQPHLIPYLAPIVSPMVAAARLVWHEYGTHVKNVFIGPCIAKKAEARDGDLRHEVSAVLTFSELRSLFQKKNIDPALLEPEDFDPPHSFLGSIFPVSGGLVRAMGLLEDILEGRIYSTSGRYQMKKTIEELEKLPVPPKLLDLLYCHGCFSGPGMTSASVCLEKQSLVAGYTRGRKQSRRDMAKYLREISLQRGYTSRKKKLPAPTEKEIREILAKTNKFTPSDELNCGACGYMTCREKAVAVYRGMAEVHMCLPFVIEELESVCRDMKVSPSALQQIREQIAAAEKLASLGQLSAGVAHELNNPLASILLYVGLLKRKLQQGMEINEELDIIAAEAKRCKKIVTDLLQFARQSRIQKEEIDLQSLLAEQIKKFAEHLDSSDKIKIVLEPCPGKILVKCDRTQITQVLVNLLSNAVDAMEEKEKGVITVGIEGLVSPGLIRFYIRDEGTGIPEENREHVYTPFFTTKNLGKGTGLGLAITYGIIKMHRGKIWFDTEVGKGTVFYVELPGEILQEGEEVNNA